LLPTCEHIYGTDYTWWKEHISDIARDYEGQCWTQHVQWEEAGKKIDPMQWGITELQSEAKPGLSVTQGIIHTGGNSGYAATNLALLLGAGRIILLGFDLMMDGKKRHFFGDHPPGLNRASNYVDFCKYFSTIKPEKYGIEIWNATRTTALNCFPNYKLEDLI